MRRGARARRPSPPEPEARPLPRAKGIGGPPPEGSGMRADRGEAGPPETDVGTTASQGKPLDRWRAGFADALAELVLEDLLKYPPDKS